MPVGARHQAEISEIHSGADFLKDFRLGKYGTMHVTAFQRFGGFPPDKLRWYSGILSPSARLRRAFLFFEVVFLKLDEKSRKKALLLLIILMIAMLIPMKIQYKDGGTVAYKAVLYSVTNLHQLTTQNYRTGTIQGTEISILFWTVYDNSQFVPDNIEHVLSPAE